MAVVEGLIIVLFFTLFNADLFIFLFLILVFPTTSTFRFNGMSRLLFEGLRGFLHGK